MYKLGLEKAEQPEIKLPTFVGSWRKQGNSRKICTSASTTTLKPLTMWITTQQLNNNTNLLFVVESLSHVQLFATPWTVASQVSLSFIISWSLLKLRFIESVMLSDHLICLPLLLFPSIFPSFRVFSNELVLYIRCTKYWSCNFSIIPYNEQSGLIFCKIDWFDLLAV